MSWILKEKWYWIIVLGVTLVLALPLFVIWVILNLPPILQIVSTILILVLWSIVAGFKDWRQNERRNE